MSDSPGQVDFAIGLVNSVVNSHNGKVKFFLENFHYRRTVIDVVCIKVFFFFWGGGGGGLVEMTFKLPHATMLFRQAVKLAFFAPCIAYHSVDLRSPI